MTQQQAVDQCSAIGGYLTDVQNANENTLINTVMTVAYTSGQAPP